MDRSFASKYFEELLNVGIALSSIHELEKLLNLILLEARRLTQADGGTLYLVKADRLIFKVSQCQSLSERLGDATVRQMYESFEIPISQKSIAGYAALKKKVLNLPDVRAISAEDPYRYDPSWDARTGYRTRSIMAVPMLNREDQVIGVFQLINAMEKGRAIPFRIEYEKLASSLASQAAVAIENAQLTDLLKQAHLDTIFRLGVAAEYRDKETANHLKRMSHFCALIAKGVGWSEERVDRILWGSLMHDVGKLGIPDAILQKPGRLTAEERRIMELHPTIGGEILKGSEAPVLKESCIIALTHHEKFDGTGYPRGLKGDDIPMEGRITILADVFDALSSKRVYKEAMAEKEVLRILEEGRGTFFDPDVLTLFLCRLEEARDIQNRFADREMDLEAFQMEEPMKGREEATGRSPS